jgi:hypothetical protein
MDYIKHIYHFIKGFNARMGVAERKVLLFVDKCASCPKHIMFKACEITFLPPYCTSLLQPLNLYRASTV